MARRYKDAQADLSSPTVADDPAAALWRGYADAELSQWTDARAQFDQGASAFYQFPAEWRARFARANAQAALALKQLPFADVAIETSLASATDPMEQMQSKLIQAEIFEAEGQNDKARSLYDQLANVKDDFVAAPALLHATQLRLAAGQMSPVDASNVLDGLRYRWRGDATELEVIRALGQINVNLGRYREALEALRSAGKQLPDLPEAAELQSDLDNDFKLLFLDGEADGLQPVQALALFYDFKELTPVGADGDLMVRKLARRLVDVDLLSQAAVLLKYQADNRLDGVPRAEVDTDLATIDLMNRQPEAALDAINASRSTLLPPALSSQRRTLEARAWLELGQYDHSLEIIESDKSGDAVAIRAEVSWKKHDWTGAGTMFEGLLGDRWKAAGPLTPEQEGRLLRAAVAYTLAGDDASLKRMHDRYQGFIAQAAEPDALRVALSGTDQTQLSSGDFAKATSENDTFVGWVQAMKTRFRQQAVAGASTAKG
jgi:tetratricopeptide (TPR) repeat protein